MVRTNEHVQCKYKMRNAQVLIRVVKVAQVKGLFMPDASIEGKQFVVEAIGPKVYDLKKGDVVFVQGKPGFDCGFLPSDSNLLVTDEKNVLLVMEPVTENDVKESLLDGNAFSDR